jgi:hypothetical protein
MASDTMAQLKHGQSAPGSWQALQRRFCRMEIVRQSRPAPTVVQLGRHVPTTAYEFEFTTVIRPRRSLGFVFVTNMHLATQEGRRRPDRNFSPAGVSAGCAKRVTGCIARASPMRQRRWDGRNHALRRPQLLQHAFGRCG